MPALEFTENLAEPLSVDRVACPCCDAKTRIMYSILTDEDTCYNCGLVASVADFRAHYEELAEREYANRAAEQLGSS